MKFVRHAAFPVLLGIVLCGTDVTGPSVAAGAETMIEEIVVVAHKSRRSLRDVAANVTVVSRQALRLELATSIADALRYTPGIDVESAGMRFGTEGISLRGIGGNRVALLIDDVPISDQFDVGSYSNATRDLIDTGFLARAEILHGPASALYGSAAIGGVVAMRTLDPRDVTGGAGTGGMLGSVWREADASAHVTALQAAAGRNYGVLAGISYRRGNEADSSAATDSLDARDYERRSAILKLAGDPVGFGFYRHESDVGSRLGSMLGSGRFSTTSALEGDDASRFDLAVFEVAFGERTGWLDDGVVRAYYSRTDVRQRTLDERAYARRPVSIERQFLFDQSTRGAEVNLQREFEIGGATHVIGAGLEYRLRRTAERRDALETGLDDGITTNVLLGEVFPLRDFPLSESRDFGLFVEDSMAFSDVTVIAGLRMDRYELEPGADPLYAGRYPFASPVAVDADEVSPKLGLVYRPTASLDVYLQYAHGFRAPPYEDANIGLDLPLFNIRAVPNPDLRSERSEGIEIGLRWRSGALSGHVAAFHTRYEDFIESKARLGHDPGSGRILFQSRNLSEAAIEGLEASATSSFETGTGTFAFDASIYWARGENRDSGQPLNSVGPAQAVLGLGWTPPGGRWQIRARGTFTDGWSDIDETGGELFEPPGHGVLDIYLLRSVGARLKLRAGIMNLTDRTYWTWSNVRGLAPGDPVLPYLAAPGRSFVLGADLTWQ